MKRFAWPVLALLASAWGLVYSAKADPVPLNEAQMQAAAVRIDQAILQMHQTEAAAHAKHQKDVPPLPPRASDEVFLRRATIDLAGRLPLADEVKRFLSDEATDKRSRLVDRLVLDSSAAEMRFRMMAEGLRLRDESAGQSMAPFMGWLREMMKQDLPYHELAANMVRAEGSLEQNAAAGMFLRDEGNRVAMAEHLAALFLGKDFSCTSCHDHPFEDATQMEMFQFAACFYRGPADAPLRLPSRYMYVDGKPGELVKPKYFLLGSKTRANEQVNMERILATGAGPVDVKTSQWRVELAAWVTEVQQERFSQMAALRVWKGLFGNYHLRGRVYEGDTEAQLSDRKMKRQACYMPPYWFAHYQGDEDFLDPQSSTHAVAKVLGQELSRCGGRIREFQRILARTEAYQREALTVAGPYYSIPLLSVAPMVRRVPPEVTWDALMRWLPEGEPERQTSGVLPQVPEQSHLLRLLGRGERDWMDESIPVVTHALTRYMSCNPLLEKVAVGSGEAVKLAADKDWIETLFLEVLGRFPRSSEKTAALQHSAAFPASAPRDVAWALLNTSEFLFEP